MALHLLSKMTISLITLGTLLSGGLASPSPQFSFPYHQPAYSFYRQPVPSSYFQPAPFSYNLNFLSPYYQPFLGQIYLHGENDKGFEYFIPGSYEDDEHFLSRTWLKPCPQQRILYPCKCFRTRTPRALPFGNIICPAQTAAQALAIFSRIPAGLNLQTVTLFLPRGANNANSLGAKFLANYPQAKITIVSSKDTNCIDSTILTPCTCTDGTITCPAGNSIAQIQAVFNRIAPNTNLGNVIIYLPPGTTKLPADFLFKNPANTIRLIRSAGARALSQLTIDSNVFAASAVTCKLFTIEQFDLGNLDYSFLANFNVLTNLLLNQCTNTPFAGNPPKRLPDLPSLISVLVDGVNYKTICPTAALYAPCKCVVNPGDQVCTFTCPPGIAIADIQNAFKNLPMNSNIGNVILNFPTGAKETTGSILGSNLATSIKLIGPAGNPLSKLMIGTNAFTLTSSKTTLFTIERFDLGNLDYIFLENFKVLTNLLLNQCTNTPFAGNPPRRLPNLPLLVSVLVDGVNYKTICPTAALYAPCKCVVNPGDQLCTFTCPPGVAIADIQKAFNNLPANSKIGNVILNIPAGASAITTSLLGNNLATSIKLIGPAVNPLSKLTIGVNAFATSASTDTQFTIQQFDVGNLDYSFLANFNVLTQVLLDQCSNPPTAADPPKKFPKLPNPVKVLVNGVIYNAQCPSAAVLDPCKCVVAPKDQVCTITCPEGSDMLDIVNAFTNVPLNSILGNVILNFPRDTDTFIPSKILGANPATTIKIIGPVGPSQILTIDPKAFTPAAGTTTTFIVEKFNIKNVDYIFLDNFNVLTDININECTNAPTAANQPKNLKKLPKLTKVSVNGINIYVP